MLDQESVIASYTSTLTKKEDIILLDFGGR